MINKVFDINSLLGYKENNQLEAKKATGGLPHSMWETYSSFANTDGGVILLGVEEKKDFTLANVQEVDCLLYIKVGRMPMVKPRP